MKQNANINVMHYIVKRPRQSFILILRKQNSLNKEKQAEQTIVNVKMTLGKSNTANHIRNLVTNKPCTVTKFVMYATAHHCQPPHE